MPTHRDDKTGLRVLRNEPGDHKNATGSTAPSRDDLRMAAVALHKLATDQLRVNQDQAKTLGPTRRTYLARCRMWEKVVDLADREIQRYGGWKV